MAIVNHFALMRTIGLLLFVASASITYAGQRDDISFVVLPHRATVSVPDCDSCSAQVSYMSYYCDSTVSKVVPSFRFRDNVVGEFLERFADSVCAKSFDYNLFEVRNMMARIPRGFRKRLPTDTVIYNYVDISATVLDDRVFSECEGVIVSGRKNVGVLNDLDSLWIHQLNLEATGQLATVQLCRYEKPIEFGDSIYHLDMKNENPVQALLKIMGDGKVDAIQLTYIGGPIQSYPEIERSFKWMEDFYRENNLPSGCKYYYQDDTSRLIWDGKNFDNYPKATSAGYIQK